MFSCCFRIRKFLFIYSVCTSPECLGRGDKPEATSTEYPSYVHISSYMRTKYSLHHTWKLERFLNGLSERFCDRSTPFGSTSDIPSQLTTITFRERMLPFIDLIRRNYLYKIVFSFADIKIIKIMMERKIYILFIYIKNFGNIKRCTLFFCI